MHSIDDSEVCAGWAVYAGIESGKPRLVGFTASRASAEVIIDDELSDDPARDNGRYDVAAMPAVLGPAGLVVDWS